MIFLGQLTANSVIRSGFTKFLLRSTLHPYLSIIQSLSKSTADFTSAHTTVNGKEKFSFGKVHNQQAQQPLILGNASTIPNIWSTQLLLDGYYIHLLYREGVQWMSLLGFRLVISLGFSMFCLFLSCIHHILFSKDDD